MLQSNIYKNNKQTKNKNKQIYNFIGGPNDKNADDSKYNDPSGTGARGGDSGDLDDSGNPNDPGNKGGKRGGTKRLGTNGKKDFDGKFGDDSKKQSPYGAGKRGLDNPDENDKKSNDKPSNDPNDGNKGGTGKDPNDDSKQEPMTSKEIGDEFRDVVSDAVSNAIMDPNKKVCVFF